MKYFLVVVLFVVFSGCDVLDKHAQRRASIRAMAAVALALVTMQKSAVLDTDDPLDPNLQEECGDDEDRCSRPRVIYRRRFFRRLRR